MNLRTPLALGATGFALGALFYGAPICLLHLRHNGVGSPGTAAALLAIFAGLYGAWCALALLASGAALAGLGRLFRRPTLTDHALFVGLFLFTAVFWFLFWNY